MISAKGAKIFMRKIKRNGTIQFVVALVLLAVVLFASYSIVSLTLKKYEGDRDGVVPKKEYDSYYKYTDPGSDKLNILLLGTDARTVSESGRSDSIILVGIDLANKKINMMSFPRDLRVTVPGHSDYGHVKLNSAYNSAYFDDGGPELVIKTIETLVKGLKIDGYIKTNFGGFVKLVNTIGGIDYNVEKNMYYKASDIFINLKAGQQHLTGEQAVGYMRFRHDGVGDFNVHWVDEEVTNADGTKTTMSVLEEVGRTSRQKKMIAAIIDQTKDIRNLTKLPDIMRAIKESYSSNINDLKLFSIAIKMRNVGLSEIKIIPFPSSKVGSILEGKGYVSYVFPPETQKDFQEGILQYFSK